MTTINTRPVYNKYCIVTVIEMLIACESNYSKKLRSLEAKKKGLTERYYGMTDIPKEISKEISDLTTDIATVTQRIEDIERAIKTIESCDRKDLD